MRMMGVNAEAGIDKRVTVSKCEGGFPGGGGFRNFNERGDAGGLRPLHGGHSVLIELSVIDVAMRVG